MQLEEAISRRRSVREYKSAPVDDAPIRTLTAFVVSASNTVNEQP
jgi:nitroreductase